MQDNTPTPHKSLHGKMLTKKEMHRLSRERVSLISKEFTDGFSFLETYPRSVTFFGSARFTEDNTYYKRARALAGRIVTDLHYSVISGGGPGIMEAANRGAFEHGGESVGLTIELPHEQVINPYLTKHLDFYYFFSRKVCMSFSAEAYVFFPGGLGTLDEVFEILTLVQTRKIEKVPVILVGSDFWKPIETMLREQLLSRGVIDLADLSLYTITDSDDQIIDIIRNAPVHIGEEFHGTSFIHRNELAQKTCVVPDVNVPAFDHMQNKSMLAKVNQWTLVENLWIEKVFRFKTWNESLGFVNKVARIAEDQCHHPDIHIFEYSKVRVVLSTHEVKGLSENDYIMAAKVDEISTV